MTARAPARAPASGARPFSREEAASFLAFADEVLSRPPARPWIERHEGRGELILRFALPLALAAPQNRSRHAQGWQLARERSAVLAAMAGQLVQQHAGADGVCRSPLAWCRDGRAVRPMLRTPLPGRPQVRAVRFSSVFADDLANWAKVPIDVLRVPRMRAGRVVPGLGVITDDRPSALEVRAWCEGAPPGMGGVLLEAWTG